MKTILILRGLIRESRHSHDFIEILKKRVDAKIICYDIKGTGKSYRESSHHKLSRNVDDFREKWELDSSTENYAIAISLGGMILHNWIERFPEDFKAVILINSSLKTYSPFYRRLKPSALSHLFLSRVLRKIESREDHVFSVVSNREELREKTVEKWTEIAKTAPVSFRNAIKQLWSAWTYKPKDIRPRTKTVLLASYGDRLADWRCTEQMEKAWGIKAYYHETGGHELTLDEPEWIIEHLINLF